MKRTATSNWKGSKEGKGLLSTKSGALSNQPYSFNMRFENEDGKAGTNPEELIGAAHAGCYNMALGLELGKAGYEVEELDTTANVEIEEVEDGFGITGIHLDLIARVSGIDDDEFQEIAKAAKEGCPVSKALSAVPIELDAKLK
jgi:osmotically inducible protein OsmC